MEKCNALTIKYKIIYTGSLVMNATKVFANCIASKFVPTPKTCGKSLLYIGHLVILLPH